MAVFQQDNFLNAFNQGRMIGQSIARQNALKKYAGGNQTGGINALMAVDPETAMTLQKNQRQIQAYDTNQKAGQMAAAGDYTGARNTALGVGDVDTAKQFEGMNEAQLQRASQSADVIANVAQKLVNVPQDQRRQYVEAMIPSFQQRGIEITPEMLDKMDWSDNGLNAIVTAAQATKAQVESKLQVVNRGNGAYDVVDLGTGQAVRSVDAMPSGDVVYQKVQNADGSESVVALPKQVAPQGGVRGGFDAIYNGFVAPQEGGYTPNDAGAPANFGINQRANPDINVKDLTQDQAKQIMYERYWVPSGADRLPPQLQAIHFDTAVNMGVGAAAELLKQSGGDPKKYLQLRANRYQSIAQNDPSKAQYLDTWMGRNNALADFAGIDGGSGGATGQVVFQSQGGAGGGQDWQTVNEDQFSFTQQNRKTGELKVINKPAAASKDIASQEKAANRIRSQTAQAKLVIDMVDDVYNDIGFGEAGLIGSAASSVPGTKAYDVARKIDTIKANLGFDALNEMRQNSPTGGALGQVAVQELQYLQSVVSSLDMGQSEAELKRSLRAIKTHYQRYINAISQDYNQSQQPQTQTQQPAQSGGWSVKKVK